MTQISKRAQRRRGERRVAAAVLPATPRMAAACCKPIDGLLQPGLFRALGDATRVALLACLAKCGRACSVTEIAECCAVDLSVVSRHLSMLESAGVLESTKRGRTVLYRVRYNEVCGMLRALADAIDECCPGGSGCSTGCGCEPAAATAERIRKGANDAGR
ncbi:MAG: winged helix-turn-helix transcriptional regulator [Phycisphaeraceae bacterium]|nr:winged helix-turn-helix transcriptional regulator [Phycisphaeraceae bacterium]